MISNMTDVLAQMVPKMEANIIYKSSRRPLRHQRRKKIASRALLDPMWANVLMILLLVGSIFRHISQKSSKTEGPATKCLQLGSGRRCVAPWASSKSCKPYLFLLTLTGSMGDTSHVHVQTSLRGRVEQHVAHAFSFGEGPRWNPQL